MRPTLALLTTFCLICFAPICADAAGKKLPTSKPAAEPTPDDPNWKMLDHVQAVFERMEVHKDDCDKAITSAVEYVKTKKKELAELRRNADALGKTMCPKAKKKAETRTIARAEKMGERFQPMMFGFYRKCTGQQIDRLMQGALNHLGSKCKAEEAMKKH